MVVTIVLPFICATFYSGIRFHCDTVGVTFLSMILQSKREICTYIETDCHNFEYIFIDPFTVCIYVCTQYYFSHYAALVLFFCPFVSLLINRSDVTGLKTGLTFK